MNLQFEMHRPRLLKYRKNIYIKLKQITSSCWETTFESDRRLNMACLLGHFLKENSHTKKKNDKVWCQRHPRQKRDNIPRPLRRRFGTEPVRWGALGR